MAKKLDAEEYVKGIKANTAKYAKKAEEAKGDWATKMKPFYDKQVECGKKIDTGEISGLGAYASCMAEEFPAKNY